MILPPPPPPPPPCDDTPPPPPPPPPQGEWVTRYMSRELLTYAIFVFGGWPQLTWNDAIRHLMSRIETEQGRREISPTTIWRLGRTDFGKTYKLCV